MLAFIFFFVDTGKSSNKHILEREGIIFFLTMYRLHFRPRPRVRNKYITVVDVEKYMPSISNEESHSFLRHNQCTQSHNSQ